MQTLILPVPHPIAALSDIVDRYDLILCDIWGVIHNGLNAYIPAFTALRRFREAGGNVILITNAPRPSSIIHSQLKEFGVPRDAYDDIVTSGDVSIAFISEKGDAPIYYIGPDRDHGLIEAANRISGKTAKLASPEQASYVLCTGLIDDEKETVDDYRHLLARLRARDIALLCANPDIVVHRGKQLLYCAGAIAQAYEAMGGKVIRAGKPYRAIYQRALQLAQIDDNACVLAIGDGLFTDILGAQSMGFDSCFIVEGIHRNEIQAQPELKPEEALQQFFATQSLYPTYTMAALI